MATDFALLLYKDTSHEYVYGSQTWDDNNEEFDVTIPSAGDYQLLATRWLWLVLVGACGGLVDADRKDPCRERSESQCGSDLEYCLWLVAAQSYAKQGYAPGCFSGDSPGACSNDAECGHGDRCAEYLYYTEVGDVGVYNVCSSPTAD